jgi:hypothetical protein
MFRTLLAIIGLALASACVTSGAIDRGVATLVGKNLDQVVATIGPPDAKDLHDGTTYLVWTSSALQTTDLPRTTPSNGRVEAFDHGAPQVEHHECRVTLGFDQQNKVSSYKWQGDTRGCGGYSKLAR